MSNLLIQILILLVTGDFTGSDAWGGIMEDDPIVTFIFDLHETFFPTF